MIIKTTIVPIMPPPNFEAPYPEISPLKRLFMIFDLKLRIYFHITNVYRFLNGCVTQFQKRFTLFTHFIGVASVKPVGYNTLADIQIPVSSA